MQKSRFASRRHLVAGLFFALTLLGAAAASADVMPACEEGQHLETNPVAPDETHHAGGQCVGEPTGCAVGAVGASGGHAGAVLFAVAALGLRRRSRSSVLA